MHHVTPSIYQRILNYLSDTWSGMRQSLDADLDELESMNHAQQQNFSGGGGKSVMQFHQRPHDSIETIASCTKFSPFEVKRIYRGFKTECPYGVVREENFKAIYAQFFPECANTDQYAHLIFKTMERYSSCGNCNGKSTVGATATSTAAINFDDFLRNLSILARGSFEERLDWIFNLYDCNSNGHLTRDDIKKIVYCIYGIMGAEINENNAESEPYRRKIDSIFQHSRYFQRMDVDNNGIVTRDEFIQCYLYDTSVLESLNVLDSRI